MNNVKIFVIVIAVLIVGVAATATLRGTGQPKAPGIYNAFAQCLVDQGAVFYGTFWCPYCQSQKKMFGSSAKLLPYVECSTADGRGQLPICQEKNIQSYPTWEFADGSRLTGAIPLDQLAAKTDCSLPGATVTENENTDEESKGSEAFSPAPSSPVE